MTNDEIIDRLQELKDLIPNLTRNAFLDELFSHYLKKTDCNHDELSEQFEFMIELKAILDEIQ